MQGTLTQSCPRAYACFLPYARLCLISSLSTFLFSFKNNSCIFLFPFIFIVPRTTSLFSPNPLVFSHFTHPFISLFVLLFGPFGGGSS